MPDPIPSTDSASDRLDAVIAAYLQQVEAGAVPDREALLAAHPDLADRLRAFFADCDRLDRQAADLRLSADADRTTDQPAPACELTRIRYFGDYELLEVIAHGGMGVVYKARQQGLNRLVALKMILGGAHASPEAEARFLAEGEVVAGLQHPNIVQTYQVGRLGTVPFFSLEYVDGGTLSQQLRGCPELLSH